jgi:hypothetical protein
LRSAGTLEDDNGSNFERFVIWIMIEWKCVSSWDVKWAVTDLEWTGNWVAQQSRSFSFSMIRRREVTTTEQKKDVLFADVN